MRAAWRVVYRSVKVKKRRWIITNFLRVLFLFADSVVIAGVRQSLMTIWTESDHMSHWVKRFLVYLNDPNWHAAKKGDRGERKENQRRVRFSVKKILTNKLVNDKNGNSLSPRWSLRAIFFMLSAPKKRYTCNITKRSTMFRVFFWNESFSRSVCTLSYIVSTKTERSARAVRTEKRAKRKHIKSKTSDRE